MTQIYQGESISLDFEIFSDEAETVPEDISNADSLVYRFGDLGVDGAVFENTLIEKSASWGTPQLNLVRVILDPTDTALLTARDYDHQIIINRTASSNIGYSGRITLLETLDTGDGVLDATDLHLDAQIDVREWLPYVMPEAPGLPRAVAMQKIVETLADFCDMTRQWRYFPPAIDVVAGRPVYPIELPWKTEICRIETITLNGISLYGRDEGQILAFGMPQTGYTRSRNNVLLHQTPDIDIAGGLKVLVSLKPQHDRYSAPAQIFENWRTAIAAGALARIKVMADGAKPFAWSDRQGAAGYGMTYSREVGRALADRHDHGDGAAGKLRGPNPMRPRRYY